MWEGEEAKNSSHVMLRLLHLYLKVIGLCKKTVNNNEVDGTNFYWSMTDSFILVNENIPFQ